jgi:acyl-CoA-dependent ceramide synthase
VTKIYLLGQWAFWLQQLITVNIKERRKDHWQMVAHHLVTILLIYTSYMLHLNRVVNVILILTDGPGIVPKGCYQGSQDALIGPTPLPKHGWVHVFQPFWNPSGRICYNETFRWVLMDAFGFLQLLMAIWFVLIVRVAIRVLKGLGADDIRSDDEGEEDAELEGAAEIKGNQKDVYMHYKQP